MKTCITFLLFFLEFTANIHFAHSALGTCKAGELRCQSSGFCVKKEKICDGTRDCEDGLDENDLICSPKFRRSLCGLRSNHKKVGFFSCHYAGCIPLSRVCDGNINCLDGSDETEHICGANSCLPGQFRCKYGACIPDSKVCNGRQNCPDGSDETYEVCGKQTCKSDEFRCKYGGCVPLNRICDGWKHCSDGSDEVPELCLITQAKRLSLWLASSRYHDEEEDTVEDEIYGRKKTNEKRHRGPVSIAESPLKSRYFESKESLSLNPNNQNHQRRELTTATDSYISSTKNPSTQQPDSELTKMSTHLLKNPITSSTTFDLIQSTTNLDLLNYNDVQSQTNSPSKLDLAGINFYNSTTFRKNCLLPTIPKNAQAIITSCRSNPDANYCNESVDSVPEGVLVEYDCDAGFAINGPTTLACKRNGIWSSTPPKCDMLLDVRYGIGSLIPKDYKVRCPGLNPSRGVRVECIDPKNLEVKSCSDRQKPGVEARFTCGTYYRPSGDLPIAYEKCNESGEWSPGVHNQFTCVPDCGLSEGPKTPYIINGVAASRGQWPWHIGIYVWVEDELKYICGGTLITELAVLTSAHCVTHNGYLRNTSSIVIFLGKQVLKIPDSDPFTQRRRVSKIIVEDSFNHLVLDSDIAILALETPAVLSFYVRPACFPQASNSFLEEYQLAQGNLGTVIGWGLTENSTLSSELRMTQLPVVSAQDCSESHPEFFASMTRSTTYCAGYRNGTSICNGDSGGGMYFRAVTRGQSRWYVQGLVSYGVPAEASSSSATKQCSSSHYAVFTRVGRYGDWLVKTLSRENLF